MRFVKNFNIKNSDMIEKGIKFDSSLHGDEESLKERKIIVSDEEYLKLNPMPKTAKAVIDNEIKTLKAKHLEEIEALKAIMYEQVDTAKGTKSDALLKYEED